MAIATGTKAPEFTLKSKQPEGLEDVSLTDHLGSGKVVLLFFPFAFTSVCTTELCSVDPGFYADLDATVFGISVDSPFAQEEMALKNGIKVKLLSDFNKDVAAAYDVLYDELLGFKGVAKRSAFVIGEDGTVVFSWASDDPHDLPDFEAIRRSLKS